MNISSNIINKLSTNILNLFNNYWINLFIILFSIFSITMTSSYADNSSASDLEKNISALEMRFFAHNYSQESVDKRIDRLEEFVFGTTKTGSEQERTTGLLQTVPDLTENPASNNETNEQGKADDASKTGDNANNANPDSMSTNTENADNTSDESYPAVTTIEQQLLGRTYETLPIKKRLAQLETKAFGKASQSTDLSERVDLLKQYVSSTETQGENNFVASEPAVTWGSHPLGLTQQIAVLEKQVLGETHNKDKLTSRLSRLEKKVFPKQPPETFTPIAARLSRLQTAVQPPQPGANYNTAQSSTDNQSAPVGQITPFTSAGGGADSYASQSAQSANSGYDNLSSNTNTTPKHHSLLHKIGQVAGVAGSMAIKSMGSGYGGYGYGGYPGYGGYSGYGYPSSGYGYSPYGAGTSSMYGYGSSPFGSSLGTGRFY